MKKMNFKFLAVLLVSLIAFSACSDDDDSNSSSNQGKAKMSLKMVDAPGDYDEVNIDVEDIVIKYSGEENEVAFGEVNAGIYDLLELTGGASVVLTDEEEIPAGNVSQIRLILGDDNTIVVDGETFPLSTPSAQQSGLKLNLNTTLEEGIVYEYILDFDVEKSIVTQGNGGYSLKPVIRINAVAETGRIAGSILPLNLSALITAENDTNEISTYSNSEGEFELNGVPEGTYTLTIQPDANLDLEIQTLTDVEVVNGETTTVGEISFE
ncbi:DUF4382 domain-containing protein [Mesonia maritima]|uniref:DUF4382 domain-containing protein n=1 Tax=Mesonia maritima TaxID=1793873 RepID=A0ABU1K220_9FLAO|nr:DUF4382 domain-containing protein [Mesonia maritima]MDR6299663.1 hypothetical protein [Mesonia maritima]